MGPTFGAKPCWLISDNLVEYSLSIVINILGDMDVKIITDSPAQFGGEQIGRAV